MTWCHVERPIQALNVTVDHHLGRGYMVQADWSANHLKKMILSQSFIKRVMTAEIKTNENTSGALDLDMADGVS